MNRPLVLLVVALLAAGCVLYRYEADSPETRTWPSANVAAVNLRLDNGAITVTAQQDTVITALITKSCKGTSQADAEAHIADITTGDSTSGTTLYLWGKVPTPNTRSYNAEHEITAPAATALTLLTVNGAVVLNNMAAAAVVTATNGAVGTTAHSGSIAVEAVNGAIDCDVAALDTAETAALHSANGRVTLYLPADASVAFDILTTNGNAKVEGFTNVNYSLSEAKHKVGTIGSGAAVATLRSENGNVTIQVRQ